MSLELVYWITLGVGLGLLLLALLVGDVLVLIRNRSLALGLGLETVGLGILHLLVVVAHGFLKKLLDGGALLLLLGLGGIAGATIGLILIRLVISTEELDWLVDCLDESLGEVCGADGGARGEAERRNGR